MSSPVISVITSVYNGEPYLAAAIESILNQTFTDFEFIVIDDASTDNTWESLCQYAEVDSRFKLIRNSKNLGYTRSLNLGLAEAQGEFIARQDADDISLTDRFDKQVAFLQQHPQVGVLGSGLHIINEQSEITASPEVFETNDVLQPQLLNDFCLHHGSVMLRRGCLMRVGVYDTDMEPTEDYDLWLGLAEITELANLPERLYLYRRHSISVSNKRTGEQRMRVAQAIERAMLRRSGQFASPSNKQIVARSYLYAALVCFAVNDMERAHHCMVHMLNLAPRMLVAKEPLASLLDHYTGSLSIQISLAFYESLFAAFLPPTQLMADLKGRLKAQLYMRQVFLAASRADVSGIEANLWQGLRHNPFWLFNRGVASLAARSALRRVQRWPVL